MEIRIEQMEFEHLDQVVELDNRCFSIPGQENVPGRAVERTLQILCGCCENDAVIAVGLHHVSMKRI